VFRKGENGILWSARCPCGVKKKISPPYNGVPALVKVKFATHDAEGPRSVGNNALRAEEWMKLMMILTTNNHA
jgi:hypothetical protein